jgi:hypothetical protein
MFSFLTFPTNSSFLHNTATKSVSIEDHALVPFGLLFCPNLSSVRTSLLLPCKGLGLFTGLCPQRPEVEACNDAPHSKLVEEVRSKNNWTTIISFCSLVKLFPKSDARWQSWNKALPTYKRS